MDCIRTVMDIKYAMAVVVSLLYGHHFNEKQRPYERYVKTNSRHYPIGTDAHISTGLTSRAGTSYLSEAPVLNPSPF